MVSGNMQLETLRQIDCLLVCPITLCHLILHRCKCKISLWRWTHADLRRLSAQQTTSCEDTRQQAQLFVLMGSTNRTKECIYTQQRSAKHSWFPEVSSNPTPVSVSCSELPPISSREKLCSGKNSAGISWWWSLPQSSQLNLIILTLNVKSTKKRVRECGCNATGMKEDDVTASSLTIFHCVEVSSAFTITWSVRTRDTKLLRRIFNTSHALACVLLQHLKITWWHGDIKLSITQWFMSCHA